MASFFMGKLCSHWFGPFVVTNVFPNGAVEIQSLGTSKIFKINGHRHLRFPSREYGTISH